MLTIEVLLSRADGQPSGALDASLPAEARRITARLGDGARIRVAHSLKDHREAALQAGDPLDRLDELIGTGLPPVHARVPITSFDAVLEVTVPDGGDGTPGTRGGAGAPGADPGVLLDAIDGLVDRLDSVVDPARSAAVLGVDHPIIDGTGSVQLFYCLYRVPELTHEQFSQFWRNQLVEHTLKTPRKSAYRQVHADPNLTVRAAKAAGVRIDDIDGVALEWYPDLAGLFVAIDWASQPHSEVIKAETQMTDFRRAMAILTYGRDRGG
jgi:hypothetical protein